MTRRLAFVFSLVVIFLTGCRLKEKQWDINVLAPLASADITFSNLVKDSSIKKYTDSSLYYVSVQPLQSISISSLLTVPDTSFEKSVSLKNINLGQRSLTDNITLGQVAKNLGPQGAILSLENGKKVPIPPISNISLGQTNIDARSFFKTATFIAGSLNLSIHNGFPVEVKHVHFKMQNQNNLAVIVQDTIDSIMPGGNFVKSYSLAGKTVDGQLILNIDSLSSPGTGKDSVVVDTSNAITVVLTGTDMQVYSATAIFPAQNLVNDMLDINYDLRGPEFKSFIIRSGFIRFTTNSTIEDTMHLFYSIPGTIKNNQPIAINMVVPPAVKGKIDTISRDFQLNGYSVDLTGQHKDTFNTFYNILQVHLDSTGQLESLSLADSIYIYYALLAVVPEYAVGYLGTKTYALGPSTLSFDFFKNFSVNKLTIPQVKVNLQIVNGIGAPVSGVIKSITAFNSKTNKSVPLLSNTYVNTAINIPAAKDTLNPAVFDIPLDNTNSNINQLLEILPDKFLYLMNFTIDPHGNTSNYHDFIYYGSRVSANLNLELPIQVGINGLTLEDTITPDLGSNINVGQVQDGTLHLAVTNDYPLSAKVQLYIIDQNNKITDSLVSATANTIPAGSADPTKPNPGVGTLNFSINQSQFQELVAKKRVIVKATLNTTNNQVVKIYSNSHFKAKLTGNFRYRNTVN